MNCSGPADFIAEFRAQADLLDGLLGKLNDAEVSCLHAPYTWTLKQVMGHIVDCERIFSTRALRIGVGDETPIPGIDQNDYVANMDYVSIGMPVLLSEFRHLREANAILAERMGPANLANVGTASETRISAKANFYILAGHVVYHYRIMESRLQSRP